MTKNLLLALACCLLATSACNIIYKQNVQQGNALEQDKLDELKLGMTMNQVAFLLGTPSIRDPFHHDRWDYLSSFSRRGGEPITRLVTLKFENAILREMIGVNPDAPLEIQSGDDTAREDSAEEDVKDEIPATLVAAQQPEEPVITAIDTPVSEDTDLSGQELRAVSGVGQGTKKASRGRQGPHRKGGHDRHRRHAGQQGQQRAYRVGAHHQSPLDFP